MDPTPPDARLLPDRVAAAAELLSFPVDLQQAVVEVATLIPGIPMAQHVAVRMLADLDRGRG